MKRRASLGVIAALLALVATAYSSQFSPAGAVSLDVTIDDFLVNDDQTSGCSQSDPEIAMNSSGDAVVVWVDWRYATRLVFARRYDSDLNPLGSSFRISDDWSTTNRPSVDMNDQGSFVVTWVEANSYDDRRVYAQVYDPEDRRIGSNVEISDSLQETDRRYTSVALNEDGSFAVFWIEEVMPYRKVLVGRVMDASGVPMSPVFQISNPWAHNAGPYHTVATNGNDDFMVTWTELGGEVLVCSFNSTGTVTAGPTVVNCATPERTATTSSIAIASNGRYLVTWLLTRDPEEGYYPLMRLFDDDGSPLTEEVEICRDPVPTWIHPVRIAIEDSGDFTLLWSTWGTSNNDLYMREYDADGNSVGSKQQVLGAYGKDGTIATDGHAQRLVVWQDFRNDDRDIYGQRYTGSVAELGCDVRINDDMASRNQRHPFITCNNSGQFSTVWIDHRHVASLPDFACYMQVFSAAGDPVSGNFEVSGTDIHSSGQPIVSMDASGRTMTVWNQAGDIRAQYFDDTGLPMGADFSVNDTSSAGLDIAAAISDSGKSVVAWRIGTGYIDPPHEGVYVRRCDEAGNPIGPSLMVNDNLSGWESSPTVAINAQGDFVVAWTSDRNSDSTGVYAQLFDSAGVLIGSNIFVGTTADIRRCYTPVVCMDSTRAFVVAWMADSLFGAMTVRAQRYDPSGTPVGQEITVNDSPTLSYNWLELEIACKDDGDFVIVWEDRPDDDRRVYAQIYDSDGNPQGNNFLIANAAGLPYRQYYPAVAANDESIFFAWEDNRGARGYDIYAKVCDWSVGLEVCGDANGNGEVDIDDVVSLVNYIFNGTQMPGSQRIGDANSSGAIDIDDVVYLMEYIFSGRNTPCAIDGGGAPDC